MSERVEEEVEVKRSHVEVSGRQEGGVILENRFEHIHKMEPSVRLRFRTSVFNRSCH